MVICGHSWLFVVTRGHLWLFVVTRGHSWLFVATRGYFVVIRGHSWSLVVTRGHSWLFVVICGHTWSLVSTFRPYPLTKKSCIMCRFCKKNLSEFTSKSFRSYFHHINIPYTDRQTDRQEHELRALLNAKNTMSYEIR